MFVRQQESLLVFLQGHPEYDADSLLREFRRDVVRYLRGERANFPQTPEDYFDPLTEKHLAAFAERVATRAKPPSASGIGESARRCASGQDLARIL